MAKTSYIIIKEPQIDEIDGINPENAEELYRRKCPSVKNIVVVPRNAAKFNGKRIPYKP